MIEVLKAAGWQFKEAQTCCGPARERWVNPNNHNLVITIFPSQGKYTARRAGQIVRTDQQNTLNEFLETFV